MLFDDPFAGLEESSINELHRALHILKNEATVLLVMRTEKDIEAASGKWASDIANDKSLAPAQMLKPMVNTTKLQIV
jgi:hypothetical protein